MGSGPISFTVHVCGAGRTEVTHFLTKLCHLLSLFLKLSFTMSAKERRQLRTLERKRAAEMKRAAAMEDFQRMAAKHQKQQQSSCNITSSGSSKKRAKLTPSSNGFNHWPLDCSCVQLARNWWDDRIPAALREEYGVGPADCSRETALAAAGTMLAQTVLVKRITSVSHALSLR